MPRHRYSKIRIDIAPLAWTHADALIRGQPVASTLDRSQCPWLSARQPPAAQRSAEAAHSEAPTRVRACECSARPYHALPAQPLVCSHEHTVAAERMKGPTHRYILIKRIRRDVEALLLISQTRLGLGLVRRALHLAQPTEVASLAESNAQENTDSHEQTCWAQSIEGHRQVPTMIRTVAHGMPFLSISIRIRFFESCS